MSNITPSSKPSPMPSSSKPSQRRLVGQAGISVKGLRKAFRRPGSHAEVVAVDAVTLDAGPGEMLVLLGPSGCGKTTLLRCIAGLEQPDDGLISIGERTVYDGAARFNVPVNKRLISMIFQSYTLWPHMTVNQNVAYPLQSRGIRSKAAIREKVSGVLRLVGLDDLGREYPGTLSGGQQQRVSLARALVTDPAAILFDEPLSNIDAQVRTQLRTEIGRMHQRLGFSGIYVTHDQEEALSIGTRVAVLERGKVAQVGTPQDVYNNPVSTYVAQFVGRANAIPGEIAALAGSSVAVDSMIGRVVVPAPPPTTLAPGMPVSVIVRPEDIGMRPIDTKEPVDAIVGKVEAVDFHGPNIEVTATVNSISLHALVRKGEWVPAMGDEIELTTVYDRLRVVAE